MIRAFTHGNTGIKIKEDTLTPFVLAQMLYLPDNLIWKIFKDSCFDKNLPQYVGKVESFVFWPHWNAKGTTKPNYVEPDVFIRFENVDIIIEAKRYDNNQQYKEQWKNEIIAYFNEYFDDKRKVLFFAIGGIWNENTETITIDELKKEDQEEVSIERSVKVFKFKWQNILNSILRIQKKLEPSEEVLYNVSALLRASQSVVSAFEMHGFFTGKWFETLPSNYSVLLNKNIENWKVSSWIVPPHYKGKKFNTLQNYHILENQLINKWKSYE